MLFRSEAGVSRCDVWLPLPDLQPLHGFYEGDVVQRIDGKWCLNPSKTKADYYTIKYHYIDPQDTRRTFVTEKGIFIAKYNTKNDAKHAQETKVTQWRNIITLSKNKTTYDKVTLDGVAPCGAVGNRFLVQISNSDGSFPLTTPQLLGNIVGETTNPLLAEVRIALPPTLAASTYYRLRVITTAPFHIGGDNGKNITVQEAYRVRR